MTGVLRRQAKGGQSVRDDVRSGGEVFAGSSSEVHDALDTIQHILGFPTGHRHILESGSSLGRGELGLGAHLAGFAAKGIQIIASRAGNGRHLAHAFVEVRRCLDGSSADTGNGKGDRHHLFPGTGDGIANGLHLLADRVNLFQRSVGIQGFLLQTLELLLGLDDFPLQGIVLVLTERAFLQLLLGLLLCGFQGFEFILGRADSFLQRFLLLGEKLRIGRVQFQKLGDILQLSLCRFDRRIDRL